MAKKSDLMTGFGERIKSGSPTAKKPASQNTAREQTISAQEVERKSRAGRKPSWDKSPRLKDTYQFTSLALNAEVYEKIREIATLNGLPYRDIVNAALNKYVEMYEAKHGPLETARESKISADSLV